MEEGNLTFNQQKIKIFYKTPKAHEIKVYRCKLCNVNFTTRHEVIMHKSSRHGKGVI